MANTMRVLVCGGRYYGMTPSRLAPPHLHTQAQSERAHVYSVLFAFHEATPITTLIEGGAAGADQIAREWARETGVTLRTFRADWNRFGKAAGPMRNEAMLDEGKPDVVIAFPGGKGTAHMVKIAKDAGVQIIIIKETA